MTSIMRCNHCGYEMFGPEVLSASIDPTSHYAYFHQTPEALLNTCLKPDHQIPCPACQQIGTWSK